MNRLGMSGQVAPRDHAKSEHHRLQGRKFATSRSALNVTYSSKGRSIFAACDVGFIVRGRCETASTSRSYLSRARHGVDSDCRSFLHLFGLGITMVALSSNAGANSILDLLWQQSATCENNTLKIMQISMRRGRCIYSLSKHLLLNT